MPAVLRSFLADFFPRSFAAVHRAFPHAVAALLPPDAACAPSQTVGIANPALAVLCLSGVVVGLIGWMKSRSTSHVLWGKAFLFYALMNLAALPCHCLAEATPRAHSVLRGLDVGFTCGSSTCLLLATLMRSASPKQLTTVDGVVPRWIAATVALAVVGNAREPQMPFLNELLYAAPTLCAFPLLVWREMLRPRLAPQARAWVRAAAAFAGQAALATLLDAPLCALFGASFTAVPLFFLGCTSSMYCLHRYLAAAPATSTPSTGTAGGAHVRIKRL